MWFEPGPGTRTCKSASCTDFPAGYGSPGCPRCGAGRCLGGLGAGRAAVGHWPLGKGGPVVDFNSDLKEICPSPLAPGGLGGDAASEISVGWHAGSVGSSGGIWGTEWPRCLRQKYKKWGRCVASLPSPRSWGTGGGLGKACSLARMGPHARRAPGWLWGLQRRASGLCSVSASAHA